MSSEFWLVVINSIMPMMSLFTFIMAIARYMITAPRDIFTHGKAIGLLFISASMFVATFFSPPPRWSASVIHLYLIQAGLFFYSFSWLKAVLLYQKEIKYGLPVSSPDDRKLPKRPDRASRS